VACYVSWDIHRELLDLGSDLFVELAILCLLLFNLVLDGGVELCINERDFVSVQIDLILDLLQSFVNEVEVDAQSKDVLQDHLSLMQLEHRAE